METVLPTWSDTYQKNSIIIDKTTICTSHRPAIIGEIGIIHNGSIDEAKKLADLAAENGADIIKTQIHIAASEMSESAKSITPSHCKEDIYKIIDDLSLSLEEEVELYEHIKNNGTSYLSTPFSHDAADFLIDLGVKAFKIGSGEFNNIPLLDRILEVNNSALIASTGMQKIEDVIEINNYIRKKTDNIILMHTTNLYPTPASLVRLESIREIMEECGTLNVGLSDHTQDNLASYGAMALGAVVIERHFTDNKDRKGPDISNSMTPSELKELVNAASIYQELRWGSKKNLVEEEDDTRKFAFASVVTKCPIEKGEIFSKENITTKRPGDGQIKAKEYCKILGKKASANICANEQLKWVDICE